MMFKEKAITALKDVGFKITKPRMWIIDFLDGNKTHPTAFDIYDAIRKEDKNFSFATIYNTLDILVKSNIVKQIKTDVKCVRFDPNTQTHGHFLCKKCNKIFDVELDNLSFLAHVNVGKIDDVEIKFYGTCNNCITH